MGKYDDLIRRQDALMEARPEYLNPNLKDFSEYNRGWNNGIKAYWKNILELPPAEQTESIPKDIVIPCGNENVMMSEDTYEELIEQCTPKHEEWYTFQDDAEYRDRWQTELP